VVREGNVEKKLGFLKGYFLQKKRESGCRGDFGIMRLIWGNRRGSLENRNGGERQRTAFRLLSGTISCLNLPRERGKKL